jgi:DNA-binding MarR family transcriptional regulator
VSSRWGRAPGGSGQRPHPADVFTGISATGKDIADDDLDEAVKNLRRLILASEHYRQAVSLSIGLGTTESQAVSSLALHGDRGQSDLARDLQLTSSASTALLDRLERQGVAERTRHPSDRRRTVVRLTERGHQIASQSERCLAHALQLLPPDLLAGFTGGLAIVADDLDTVARATAKGRIEPVSTHALPAV